jgi:transposase InsO family protein
MYVILDIYSRDVAGWLVASCESAALAEKLIAATCAKQQISRDHLTIHADRGSSMTSKPVTFLLADLGIIQSHPGRPRRHADRRLRRPSRAIRPKAPAPPELPVTAWINQPPQKEETTM